MASKSKAKLPTFVIKRDRNANAFMKVANGSINWVGDPNAANQYTSKYAAKQHLFMLDNVPDTRVIERV